MTDRQGSLFTFHKVADVELAEVKPPMVDKQLAAQVTRAAITQGEVGIGERRAGALAAARRVAARGRPFTTDDVWLELGWIPKDHDAASFMGSVMRHLSQAGEITSTGEYLKSARPEQHRKPIRVWVGIP